jgi:hypothetical protein
MQNMTFRGQICFHGAVLRVSLVIDSAMGKVSEVRVTNAELIDWLRAQGRYLTDDNNSLGRLVIARIAIATGGTGGQHGERHKRTTPQTPKTSAEFRFTWPNFIRFLRHVR